MTDKRSLEDLSEELEKLTTTHCFAHVKHVKSGGLYVITGFSFNAVTDAIDVIYSTFGAGHAVKFNRDWEQFRDGRFVFVGGHVSGNAELDAGAPNRFDASKRGFSPK